MTTRERPVELIAPTAAEIEALVIAAQEAELTLLFARNRREAAALRAALAPFVARTYGE